MTGEIPMEGGQRRWSGQSQNISIRLDLIRDTKAEDGFYVSLARRLADGVLQRMDIATSLREDAMLVAAELVQNAHRHSRGLSMLHVTYATEPEMVYVVAVNPAPDDKSIPMLRRVGEHIAEVGVSQAEHGHGLELVDELSHRWGQVNVEGYSGKREFITYAELQADVS